jgi:hypothetical protein
LCAAYNFRSDQRSVFNRPLANKWLNVGAISLTVSPVLELTKWMLRRGGFGYTSN